MKLPSQFSQLARRIISGTLHYTRDFLSALSEEEQQTLHAILHKTAHSLGYTWQ